MKRIAVLGIGLLLLVGCRDSQTGDNSGMEAFDAGPLNLPDARVVQVRSDSGPSEDFPQPTLTQVSPNYGPETGGTRVTLRGTSFMEPAEVFFQGIPATNVVVLDHVSIAATTPAGVIGPADVRVITPGGVADLPRGFRYHLELRVDSIEPARVPEEGGVEVTVRGKGFDDLTVVLMDRKTLRGTRVIDSETIVGYVPALEPGRPEIHVYNAEADVKRSDVVFVYATPEIRSLAPGFGPIGTVSVQALDGDGFEATETVEIGGQEGSSIEISGTGATRIDVLAPALSTAGVKDVRVANADAEFTLPGAYIAFDPNNTTPEILGVIPNRAELDSESVLTIVGHSFGSNSSIRIGGQAANVVAAASANEVSVILPTGLSIGSHDVELITSGSTLTALTVRRASATARSSMATLRREWGRRVRDDCVSVWDREVGRRI